jgi:hypothetical protein
VVVKSTKTSSSLKTSIRLLINLLWASGIVFFILNSWYEVEGEFGLEKHALQLPTLQIHGLLAFISMITFGYLLRSHTEIAFKIKPIKKSGLLLLAGIIILIITGYLLYYTSHQYLRAMSIYIHLGVGGLLPVSLILHIHCTKRIKRVQKNDH